MDTHPAANCFGAPDLVEVSSSAALASAVASAPPGRQILLAPGAYDGGSITFSRKGAPGAPIVIRPRDGIGTVTIKGPQWTLANTSAWLVFSGLNLEGGQIILRGDHNRLTRCKHTGFGVSIRMETARDCRIDHWEWTDPSPDAARAACINYRGAAEYGKKRAARNLIDHNHFHDLARNCLAIDGFADTSLPRRGNDVARGQSITVHRNLFENIGWSAEFVLIKVGGMVWSENTLLGINGTFQTRSAAHTEVSSNWIEGGEYMGICKAWGKDSLWIGNRIVTGDLWVPCGNADTDQVTSGDAKIDSYHRAAASAFIGNSMGSGRIRVGDYHKGGKPTMPAVGIVLEGNTRDDGLSAHTLLANFSTALKPCQTGTTVRTETSMAFAPAVKLTARDVGVSAPDPFCS